MQTTRTLVIMRHAKAEATAATDHERRLTPRGEADARAAGEWLRDEGVAIDHVLVSSAARVLDTWQQVARGTGLDLEPEVDASLYAAGPESAVDLVRLVGDDVSGLLVIGHNPTLGQLAQLLDDGECDPEVGRVLAEGFPTSAVAIFHVPVGWSDLELGGARLVACHVGRG